METPGETATAETSAFRLVSIIKVEDGYVIATRGKVYKAKNAEEVDILLRDKFPDKLAIEPEPVSPA